MKTIKTLGALAACALLLMQGCTKKEASNPKASRSNLTSDKRNDVTGTIATGSYKLITDVSTTDFRTIGPVGASTANNAVVEQRDFFSDKGQEWTINNKGGGEYTIINKNSGKALEVPFGNPIIGSGVWQNALDPGNDAQRWIITEQATAGIYRIASKLKTAAGETVGLTVENGDPDNGTHIILQKFINNNSLLKINRVAYKDKAATNFFRRTTGWIAGDGGCSVKMSNGNVIWMMDDSNLNSYSGGTMSCIHHSVNNVALIQDFGDWTPTALTVLGPGGGSLADSHPNDHETFNWLSAGFQANSTQIYWKASVTNTSGTSAGADRFAVYNIQDREIVAYPTMPGSGDKVFGGGFIVDVDDWVYTYGIKEGDIIPCNVYVARFEKSAPLAAWKFWNGTAWVTTPSTAVPVGEAANNVPFVSKVNGVYIMISTEFTMGCGNSSKRIYSSTSTSPTGPFSVRKEIYRIPDKFNDKTPWFYWGKIHPEYTEDNEVLLTYDVNAGENVLNCAPACAYGREDPDRYRPRAIRVPLKLIDPVLF